LIPGGEIDDAIELSPNKRSYHRMDFIRKFGIRSLEKEKHHAQDFQTNPLDLRADSRTGR
jgi:hypothetical protein